MSLAWLATSAPKLCQQELAAIYPKNHRTFIELYITDVTSVKKATEETAALLPNRLDCLIDNAGISLQAPTPFQDWGVSHVFPRPFLAEAGIIVDLVHRGWVQTDMGDPCKAFC